MSRRNRRQFLQSVGVVAVATVSATNCGSALAQSTRPAKRATRVRSKILAKRPPPRLFKLGLASYSLRKFDLEQTLAMTRRVGLKQIALKSFHLPLDSSLDKIKGVAAKVKRAGLNLYGGGVIYMKDEAAVHQAFAYAQAAGMKVIIGVPAPNLLQLVEQKVKEYDIKVAIHNHGPGDKVYPTPASAYVRIKDLDRRIGLCNDIGHTQRAGVDPSESVESYADRLLDIHMKDVSAATAQGHGVEIGRGVIDITKFLKTLLKIRYTGVVSFEYEKDANDPLPGLAESVGYVRGVLAAI